MTATLSQYTDSGDIRTQCGTVDRLRERVVEEEHGGKYRQHTHRGGTEEPSQRGGYQTTISTVGAQSSTGEEDDRRAARERRDGLVEQAERVALMDRDEGPDDQEQPAGAGPAPLRRRTLSATKRPACRFKDQETQYREGKNSHDHTQQRQENNQFQARTFLHKA